MAPTTLASKAGLSSFTSLSRKSCVRHADVNDNNHNYTCPYGWNGNVNGEQSFGKSQRITLPETQSTNSPYFLKAYFKKLPLLLKVQALIRI